MKAIKRFFNSIFLFFTDRPYFYERRRYLKLQRHARREMIKLSREFAPWSGWYFHEMAKLMIRFYYHTYKAGDCCWSAQERIDKIADSLQEAIDYIEKLEELDEMGHEELLALGEADPKFEPWLARWEKKNKMTVTKDVFKSALIYEYFDQKYTKTIYDIVGKHVWEWCD